MLHERNAERRYQESCNITVNTLKKCVLFETSSEARQGFEQPDFFFSSIPQEIV